ncbi:hypothetical protein Hdeb2414_s0004g00149021 [Helianthus debilis subsp. tardiflorus]
MFLLVVREKEGKRGRDDKRRRLGFRRKHNDGGNCGDVASSGYSQATIDGLGFEVSPMIDNI